MSEGSKKGSLPDFSPEFNLEYVLNQFDKEDLIQLALAANEELKVSRNLATACRQHIYETTHLSPENKDGSHDCRISKTCLDGSRAALKAYDALKGK